MGGGGNSAQQQAEAREREAQMRIAAGTRRVNQVIDSPERQAQIQQFLDATRQQYRLDLDRQNTDATRENKFALLRSGNYGGSLQRDVATEQGERYQRGLLEAERRGQEAAAGVRAAEEDSRARLIAQVQGGLDMTSAGQNAAAALRNNLAASQSSLTADALGDVFGNFASLYKKSQEQAEYRRGLKQGINLYDPGPWAAIAGGNR